MNDLGHQAPALQRLARCFIDHALPLWVETGYDAESGHFIESLRLDGTPESTGRLRVRTAARQIYVYAHAAVLGVAPADCLARAERAWERLHSCAWAGPERPGYVRVIDRQSGTVVGPARDLYDHACVLLALAWLYRATERAEYRDRADQLLAAVDASLADPHGGWAEDDEGTLPRRQNPHMHMFEALLALYETTGRASDRRRLDRLFNLFMSRFCDADGLLVEYFGPRWQIAHEHASHRRDPGHMAEWTWLLGRYDSLTGRQTSAIGDRLVRFATSKGRDPKSPFLLDEVDVDGRPLKPTRRLWPQAELMKAHLTRYDATGETSHLEAADAIAEALFDTYLADTPVGTWRDCFDLEGRSVAGSIPASSNYHLWTAVAFMLEIGRKASAGPSWS